MKNIIVVLLLVLASISVSAQDNLAKKPNSSHNKLTYSSLNSLLSSGKKHSCYKTRTASELIAIYRAQHAGSIRSTRHITLMYGSTIFTATREMNNTYHPQRYLPVNAAPLAALELLGVIAGPIVSSFYPSYIRSIYHNSGSAIAAYLQSTYTQHESGRQ